MDEMKDPITLDFTATQKQENYRAHHQIDGILGVNVKPCAIAAVKLPHKV